MSKLSKDLNLQALFEKPNQEEWMKLTEKVLNGAPFEKKVVTKTLEGISLQPVYDRRTVEGHPYADTTPGEFPYIRGTAATGKILNSWEICQALPYPSPEEFNTALKEDLARGQDSALLILDEDGRKGEEPSAQAGTGGTAIHSPADLKVALDGVNLTEVPLHIEAGSAAPVVAGALKAAGLTPVSGSVCSDPLAALAVEGVIPMDLTEARDLQAGHVAWMAENFPGLRSVGVDVSWSVNAGGNAVTELALMLASAAENFRELTARGVDIQLAASKSMVKFAIGSDYFMEVAKFRAARGLWAHLVKACGGEGDACKLYQFAGTSAWQQTKLDPYVNLLRATSQGFSAVVGGVDAMRLDPFDAPFGLPDTFSRRIARNIQLVLRHEAHLNEVVDPAGGSWTIENLTQELSARAWAKFQEIEKAGGLLVSLQQGTLQDDLKEQMKKQHTLLAQRRLIKVGSNQFAFPDEKKLPLRAPDCASTLKGAQASVDAVKANRDQAAMQQELSHLLNEGSMETMVNAIAKGATFSEVISVTGQMQSARINPVVLGTLTAGYEDLREDLEAYLADHDRPTILMAQMGPVKQHKIRSDFSQEFLKPSGFTIDASQSFDSAAEAAAAVIAAKAEVTVLCSTDDTYPDLVPEFAKAVKAGSPDTVVLLAGLLPDLTEEFKAAGVDDFIHLKANNLDLLKDLHATTGVAQ
ncbi:methylmalonyl-CoA mutase family protein [Kiritimatiellota bacterium B12222]|nr:methylmalonyl-CoA mutase family protein [Kiritimatiellota bacterium B12222]